MQISFRSHHFLCALCFQGKGYSGNFVANFITIMQHLQQNPESKINVVNETDSICAPCPHKKGRLCETQDKITRLDKKHSSSLGFHPGEIYTWQSAKKQLHTKLSLAVFHTICDGCDWKKAGICEAVITDFLRDKSG